MPVSRAAGVVGELARGNAMQRPGGPRRRCCPWWSGSPWSPSWLPGRRHQGARPPAWTDLRADYRLAAATSACTAPHQPAGGRAAAGRPELAAVAAFRDANATVAGESGVTAVDPAQLGKVLSLEETGGALSDLDDGASR